MSLPKAVREQEAKAEALYEEVYNQTQNAESEPAPEPEQQLDLEAQADQGTAQDNSINFEQEQEQEPQPEPQQEQVGSHDEWEHRYKVLSGKYNSEVPRLAADNRELKSTLKRLESELDTLKKSANVSSSSLLKPEDIEEYGEGFIDVVRRAAREEISSKDQEINELKMQIDALSNKTTKTVEIDFYEDLGRMVPEWVAINDDKNFHRWLDGIDELTGRQRQQLLSDAEAERDAKRVSNFFNAFRKANKTWAATANKSLESQVVPEQSKQVPTPPAKRIWTRSEINSFYSDYRRGAIDDKRAVALEADIQAALIEGRVR
jgi:hypothetical protein